MIDLDELESHDLKNENGEFTNEKIKKIRFRFLKLFSQEHNIVIYIRGLSARTEHFKTLIERMILMDNRTKWNS
jgi:hypothetical protein